MQTIERICQRDSFSLDKPVETILESDHLCFVRFIGGNASETEELVNHLHSLKEKDKLLIGVFRFPFAFEGKKRTHTAACQYFRMKELCDAVMYFHSDSLMNMIDNSTPIRDALMIFNSIEDYTIESLLQLIDKTGEMNIDLHDIKSFVNQYEGPLFIHTVEGDSLDQPLKYLITTPYLPEDFFDGKQLIINIGYTRDVDMETFRQLNLRLHDLFSKADIFKIGSYFIDEPDRRFKLTLIVNGMNDPIEAPDNYKKIPKYNNLLRKWHRMTELGRKKFNLLKS